MRNNLTTYTGIILV